MLDQENYLVKAFRMARDRFKSGETRTVSLRLSAKRSSDSSQYNTPTVQKMAGLIVGDIGDTDYGRDIIVEHQRTGLKHIDDLHPAFMAMQYPLLFPYGEDGYRLDIPYKIDTNKRKLKRGNVTRREYYAYMIQHRAFGLGVLIKRGKLFQQFIVDAFTCIEDERLRYIRFKHQQDHYRSEIYKGIQDAFLKGDVAGNAIGQRVILPSSFTGSPRYMIQNYHDVMAICRSRGNPDLFITFTCNVNWSEICSALALIPGQKSEDRPAIISRVFHMKLQAFMDDIKKENYFGKVERFIYTVEFQKRGLPHVHIILWLHPNDKFPSPIDIDRIIAAEIPDKDSEPQLFSVVSKFMMHGPCGLANPKALCMKNGKCMKYFPKKHSAETIVGEDGYAIYRRRNDGKSILKNGIELDNRFVVPYNKGLLRRYGAHINVEWCNRSRSIKYLFKYVNKGSDRTRAFLQENTTTEASPSESKTKVVDEVKLYVDCRYVSAYESTWRIFEFHIHCKFPAVQTLSVHMPLMNSVVFRGNLNVESVISRPGVEKTMLTEWMFTNCNNIDAQQLTYPEFPSFWRWDSMNKIWFRRKKGHCLGHISHISYIHPSAGDVYYLRMLLSHVRGPRNFIDIRTFNGVVYKTFKEVCNAMGLIGNDKEWLQAMDEASHWATPYELRNLFVTLILFCEVIDVNNLFETNLQKMQEDIVYKLQQSLGVTPNKIPENQLKDRVLIEIEKLLKRGGSSLLESKLPQPNNAQMYDMGNRILMEEMSHNTVENEAYHNVMKEQMNDDQNKVYDAVMKAMYEELGGLFFVYGHGGTGKTFLYKVIINKLCSEGKIVLAVASSGIASLLLPGGRTAHLRLKIPIDIHEDSNCHIKKDTHLAELLKKTSLIVWDEAPMAHRHCFEALDRSLNDILSLDVEEPSYIPFGGKVVLLGGDFWQILPVVVKGSRHDTIRACITQSQLWQYCKVYILRKNMRLLTDGLNEIENNEVQRFADWLLDIGEGKADVLKLREEEETATWIKIP